MGKVSSFIMNMKKNTCLVQQKVDWKNLTSRVRTVLERASRATAAFVASIYSCSKAEQAATTLLGWNRS
jgi:hypothetical protein